MNSSLTTNSEFTISTLGSLSSAATGTAMINPVTRRKNSVRMIGSYCAVYFHSSRNRADALYASPMFGLHQLRDHPQRFRQPVSHGIDQSSVLLTRGVRRDHDAVNERPGCSFHQPEIGGIRQIRLVAHLVEADVLQRLYKVLIAFRGNFRSQRLAFQSILIMDFQPDALRHRLD